MSQVVLLERELEDTKIALCNCSLDYVISLESKHPPGDLEKRLERLSALSKRYSRLVIVLNELI